MNDSQIRARWREAGGKFHGPNVEHGSMEERALLRFLGSLYNDIQKLRDLLTECASDLECEIEARYRGIKDHPATNGKYERDMDSVKRACIMIGKT